MNVQAKAGRYFAFISYSHGDRLWADWLHKALETYRVPKRLVGRTTDAGIVPERLLPIFRDSDELATAADLNREVEAALAGSANLVVICSPLSARSRWVNEEVLAFKRSGRSDRICCLIVEGEPNATDMPGRAAEECFAPALRYALDAGGRLAAARTEPIAADVRPGKDGRTNAKLKLIAGLLDIGLDELKQRDLRRRHQHMMLITAVSLFVMVIATALAVDALIARRAAERRQKAAENLIGFMLGDLNDKLRQVQRLDILDAVNNQAMAYFLTLPTQDVTDQALALRVNALQKIGEVREDQGNLTAALESHRTASALAAELLRRSPADPGRQAAYAETLNYIGRTYWYQGDLAHAFENFQQAVDLLQRATIPGSPDERFAALASARTNAGRVLEARGEFATAKVFYESVLDTIKTLVSHDAAGIHWQSDLADAYDSLGKVALEQGQLTRAIAAYGKVRQIRVQLSTHSPGDRSAQEDLVLSDAILGRALALCGAENASVHYVGEAVSTARALVKQDATYTDWREELGEYSRLLGNLARTQHRFDEAATHDREALTILTGLVATDKTNATWRRELASSQVELAHLELARGELAAAQSLLDTALHTISGERASSSQDRNLMLLEAQAEIVRGQVAARLDGEAAAREYWMRSRDAMAAVARVGADPNFLSTWASALLLLDDADGARPVLGQLAAMGYRTRDLDALLLAKRQSYPHNAASLRCGGSESELTAGFPMP